MYALCDAGPMRRALARVGGGRMELENILRLAPCTIRKLFENFPRPHASRCDRCAVSSTPYAHSLSSFEDGSPPSRFGVGVQ